MLRTLKKIFFKSHYEPLNKISISKANIKHNYKYLKFINSSISIAPVLKSNAYGHGIKQIAEFVDELNAPFIAVDSIYEAYELLKMKVKTPILIMGYVEPENLRIKKLPFSYAVFSLDYAKEILKYQPEAKLHIFVDTGMNREGFSFEELQSFVTNIPNSQFPIPNLEGLMSHFASADEDLNPQTDEQLKNFEKAFNLFKDNNIELKYRHISATFGILNNKNFADIINVARSGFGFFGYGDDKLRPALELTTKIAQIKELKKGERVGYNGTFVAEKAMKIAVLPIGYANGLDRRLSNKGIVKCGVKNVECRIIGRISMNITMIDVSDVSGIKVNDSVQIISPKPSDASSLKNIARLCDTIEYDILVGLDGSIRREVV